MKKKIKKIKHSKRREKMKTIKLSDENYEKIKLSDETYEKIKELLKQDEKWDMLSEKFEEGIQIDISSLDGLVGKKIFFRTITYHLLGKVEKIFGQFVKMSEASWIADSGRFMNFLKNGDIEEVEPVGTVWVNINSVTDFFLWNHDLPKDQK